MRLHQRVGTILQAGSLVSKDWWVCEATAVMFFMRLYLCKWYANTDILKGRISVLIAQRQALMERRLYLVDALRALVSDGRD